MAKYFVICLVLILGACSNNSKELTRSQAKKLIGQHETFVRVTKLPLANRSMIDAGVNEGLWNKTNFFSFELTDDGKRYFVEINLGPMDFSDNLVLKEPAKREVVEVTGITSGIDELLGSEAIKEVQFTWKYVGLSEVVTRYSGEIWGKIIVYEGAALMKLYDDGWRVEQVELNREKQL